MNEQTTEKQNDNDTKTVTSFHKLGLSEKRCQALKKKGFSAPTPIQERIIDVFNATDDDIIGISQTGSGKTASFGLPILDQMTEQKKQPQVIILAPTRELAIQVSAELSSYSSFDKIRILTVYGGSPITNQIKSLKQGVEVVVGTPGRVLDLMRRSALKLNEVRYVVLDEADEMLNMGFIEDIETVLEASPDDKRLMLFSATMPPRIKKLSKKYMEKQNIVDVRKLVETKPDIEHRYYIANREEKYDCLRRLVDFEENFYGIVFCMTKADVDDLTIQLQNGGYKAEAIHGDVVQIKREKILNQFKTKKIKILVATDVAARGIDVTDLNFVVNHSIPKKTETYVHRIGRTARAGKSGIAISFVGHRARSSIQQLEKSLNYELKLCQPPSNKELFEKHVHTLKRSVESSIDKEKGSHLDTISSDFMGSFENKHLIRALLNKLLPKPSEDTVSVNNNVSNKPEYRKKRNRSYSSQSNRNDRRSHSRTNGKGRRKQSTR
jgi:ATP-dependent RNA helicase DeaD